MFVTRSGAIYPPCRVLFFFAPALLTEFFCTLTSDLLCNYYIFSACTFIELLNTLWAL